MTLQPRRDSRELAARCQSLRGLGGKEGEIAFFGGDVHSVSTARGKTKAVLPQTILDTVGAQPLKDGTAVWRDASWLNLTACYMLARTTSFLQRLNVTFMGPLKAQRRKLCALDMSTDLLATLVQETGELVAGTRVDTWLSAIRRRITSWVDEAMKNLSTRTDIHEIHLHVEESLRSALLQDAKNFPTKGGLMGDLRMRAQASENQRRQLQT